MEIENENKEGNLRPKTTPSMATPVKAMQTPVKGAGTKTPKTRPKTATKAALSPTSSISSIGSTAREAARLSKINSTAEKVKKVADLKERWAAEKERKLQFHQEKRSKDAHRLNEAIQSAAEGRKQALEAQERFTQEQQAVLAEQLSSSLEARAQQATDLERMEKERKRRSVLLNSEIQRKGKEREIKMKLEKVEEETSLHSSRRLDFLSGREAKKMENDRKRESLAMRGVMFQKQREAGCVIMESAAEEERSYIEFRIEASKKDREYKEEIARRNRESMAGRIDEWRSQKAVEKSIEEEQKDSLIQDLELRHNDWADVQAYRAQQEKHNRMSLAQRLDKWREEKKYDSKVKTEELEAEVLAAELKQQEAEDLRAYEDKIRQSRRESLSYRLEKARKDKDVEKGQEEIQSLLEQERIRLDDLDRAAVSEYKEKTRADARQSLAFRNQLESHNRKRLEGEAKLKKEIEQQEFDEKAQSWRDLQAYQQQQRDEQRKELADRLVENSRQQQAAMETHRQALDAMHFDLESRRMGWVDVQASKQAARERSRKSMGMRLESWRQQRLVEEMLRAKKALVAEEDARLRELDREALLEAEHEVRLAVAKSAAKVFVR